MSGANPPESPLTAAAEVAGDEVTSAFELLSNETRLAILLALWEAYDPGLTENPLSFSELYDRVGVRDSGNFTYHLDKLTGHFVAETDVGYELRDTGLNIVRAVIAGTGLERATLAPTDLEMACTRCGERTVEVRYRSGSVYLTCTNCAGITTSEQWPSGTIAVHPLDPAGLAGREPREVRAAAAIRYKHTFHMMEDGVCPACSGMIDTSLQLCEDHSREPGEVCPNCGTRDSARVRHVCTVCKHWEGNPVEILLFDHPAVISFYYERGIDTRISAMDVEGTNRVIELIRDSSHTVVSTDPVRIRVTVPYKGDELQLTLDENLDVLDVAEEAEDPG